MAPGAVSGHATADMLTAGLLENLSIEMYGDRVPLRSLAAISIRDAQTLLVSPWDKEVSCWLCQRQRSSRLP